MSKVKIPGWPEALTPQMPGIAAESGMDHPFAGGFDFVKNLWAGVPGATPGFVVPTFDVAEIDKRIKDLNAALTWLEMNVHMLKASIQGLEVQRNTIAALQAISG